jgi:magnesium transporter
MISSFIHEQARFIQVDRPEDSKIVRIVKPSPNEIELISSRLGIPTDFLSAAIDRDERPRVEFDEGVKLLIIRIPHREEGTDTPYTTLAMGIIITPTHVVTVCSEDSSVWRDFLELRVKMHFNGDPVSFLCHFFLHIARQYLYFVNLIHQESDKVEREIHKSLKNVMLIRLLNLEKCIVYFSTSLRANESTWERFPRIFGRELTENELELLQDIKIEFRQAQEQADIYSNILSSMMDAFASIISNNLNVIMKMLTSITIILMMPTLVASLYGMNVSLPFQNSPHAFLITLGISFLLSFGSVLFFWRMRYF